MVPKPGMGVQAINTTAQELKADRSKVQGYLYIYSDLEANLEYRYEIL